MLIANILRPFLVFTCMVGVGHAFSPSSRIVGQTATIRTSRTTLLVSTTPFGNNVNDNLEDDGHDLQQQQQHYEETVNLELRRAFHIVPLSDKTKQFNKTLIRTIKNCIGVLFDADDMDRWIAKFFCLETIARMPYFSYVSILHLYETFGQWRHAELLKLHFAQDYNEQHHLLITESLGGNTHFFDRFVASHLATFYFFGVVAVYLYNPNLAYHLNQMVEEEAFHSYDTFLKQFGEYLQTQPAPDIAKKYYANPEGGHCVPTHDIETLYDTFLAIRNDEAQHAQSMERLQV